MVSANVLRIIFICTPTFISKIEVTIKNKHSLIYYVKPLPKKAPSKTQTTKQTISGKADNESTSERWFKILDLT